MGMEKRTQIQETKEPEEAWALDTMKLPVIFIFGLLFERCFNYLEFKTVIKAKDRGLDISYTSVHSWSHESE